MKLFSALFCLFICASVQASQGFYRENIISPTSPLSVLDPAKRPEIERLAQNLRFFGQLGARPANNVYVHYQAIQNLLVYPQSPVTALSWMLFPISPLPTINPNNIGMSDPLGKMTPEQLGKLIAVIAGYEENLEGFHLSRLFLRNEQLQELYQIFVDPKKVAGFTANHKEDDLKEFYRYALIDGVSKYVHRNMTPMDENLDLTAAQQAACIMHPHLLVTATFKSTSSHLLEIPDSEILREAGETWFTQAELEAGLKELPMAVKDRTIYKKFSDQGRAKFRTMATVDMLWKSAQSAPNETLQLLTHYAWRRFGDQIDKVLLASHAIDETQTPELMRILATPYTKADYQEIVAGVQSSEDIDGFMDSLTVGEHNLLLYGGARYAQIRFQDYGNVRVEHGGRTLTFTNCAEMSLFNLTYLTQIQEQEMGLERSSVKLLEGSLLQTFWQSTTEEDLRTTETRNKWTQAICRLNGVVYRKGGAQRSPWTEDSATAHWAELNPGILNQMRTLFHLLGKPEEATALTYVGSTEATIEAAALCLSQLLSGEPTDGELSFEIIPTDGELSFEIIPSEIKNLSDKKDWYGKFDIIRNGEKLADWYVESGHSILELISKKAEVFPLDKPFTNPYIIGQLKLLIPSFVGSQEEYEVQQQAQALSLTQFTRKLESLKVTTQSFETLFAHANLSNEEFRGSFQKWLVQQDESFHQYAHQIMYGVAPIDENWELSCMAIGNSSFNLSRHTQKLLSFNALGTHVDRGDLEISKIGKIALNYRRQFSRVETSEADTFLPENRHTFLFLCIYPTSCVDPSFTHEAYEAADAIKLLSTYSFPQLRSMDFYFEKKCQSEEVSEIAQFLPTQLNQVYIGSSNHDHLVTFMLNTQLKNLTINVFIEGICPYAEYTNEQHLLPSTIKKYAYNLLLPLAKAGQPFEPPFIDLHTNEDLERTYETLRIVAAIHKPMPLMLEDGVA